MESPLPRITLDHAATTPILPQARAAMAAAWETWANPSSPHREGRAARAALEEARGRIRAALGWTGELIFTSGATEAIGLGLATSGPLLAGATEHLAVLQHCPPDTPTIPVGADGLIDAGALRALVQGRPGARVAIQHVNSETGIVQPIEDLAAIVKAAGGSLLVDCAQSAGKLALPSADLLVVSAHKLGGPPGIGALLVRDLALLRPFGRGQEQGYRPGTENLPAILGFTAALEGVSPTAMTPWVEEQVRWRILLDEAVKELGGAAIGGSFLLGARRIPTIASYHFPSVSAASLLMRLDLAGFAVSAGSACSSGSLQTSHVLAAMGVDEAIARGVVRVSFGWSTTWEEVERFIGALATILGTEAEAA